MGAGDIAFPNLGIYLENVPKNFSVFGFTIALYGCIIALGMLAGVLLAAYVAKSNGYDQNLIWDFCIYGIVFGVLGARVYYVIFDWKLYADHPLEIFNLRNGGLAIYGGVIAAFLTCYIFTRIKKMSFFTLADLCVPGLALGQSIGRWGNFCNREAFGQFTDSVFAMRIPTEVVRSGDISESIRAHMESGANYIQVHPTFLYESMWNLVLVLLMVFVWKHRKFDGHISLLYLGGYGLGRVWIEGLRTDQLLIPGTQLAVSQVLAGVLLCFSVVTYLIVRYKQKKMTAEEKN